MFGITIHAVGWPIPRGGAGAIPWSLIGYLNTLGGTVHTSRRVDAAALRELEKDSELILFDTAPRHLLAIAGDRIAPGYRRAFERFQQGPGAFKVDYALSQPVPWRAQECYRAITVHLGGTFEEIAASEDAVAHGRCAERPFVLAAQPTLYDPSRAPQGKHVLWAYCHVPNGSNFDMTERIGAQIERFAPGFRDCVLARHVSLAGRARSHGRESSRRRHQRRRHDHAADDLPPRSAQLLHRRAESVSVFGIYASGRRRARHVRLSRGAALRCGDLQKR